VSLLAKQQSNVYCKDVKFPWVTLYHVCRSRTDLICSRKDSNKKAGPVNVVTLGEDPSIGMSSGRSSCSLSVLNDAVVERPFNFKLTVPCFVIQC